VSLTVSPHATYVRPTKTATTGLRFTIPIVVRAVNKYPLSSTKRKCAKE
jgi:hypothetical protein